MNEIIACQYLIDEVKKTLETIKKTDPSTQDYHAALHSLECLYGLATDINNAVALVEGESVGNVMMNNVIPFPTEAPAEPEPTPVEEPAIEEAPVKTKGKSKAKKDPEPEEEAKEVPAPAPATRTYTKADVRKALHNARNEGFDIVSIYQQYGVNNINELSESAYAEIVELYGDN